MGERGQTYGLEDSRRRSVTDVAVPLAAPGRDERLTGCSLGRSGIGRCCGDGDGVLKLALLPRERLISG